MNRINFVQEQHQEALVFKLLGRPEEGKLLTLSEIEDHFKELDIELPKKTNERGR